MQQRSIFDPSFLRALTSRTLLCTFIGAAIGATSQAAQAPSGVNTQASTPRASHATGLAQQCENADLIFEGVVESIRHRNSDVRHGGDVSLPHTFVTFRVARTFKGGIAGSVDGTLTLRFLGGPDGTGRTLHVSHGPEFQIGSREILLVQNSETWGIPLVSGNERRFRFVDGKTLSESGMPIEFAEGRVRVRPLDKANEETLTTEIARSMQAEVFRNTLQNMIENTRAARLGLASAPVATIAFEQPFFVPAPTESVPQVLAGDLVDPVQTPESRR